MLHRLRLHHTGPLPQDRTVPRTESQSSESPWASSASSSNVSTAPIRRHKSPPRFPSALNLSVSSSADNLHADPTFVSVHSTASQDAPDPQLEKPLRAPPLPPSPPLHAPEIPRSPSPLRRRRLSDHSNSDGDRLEGARRDDRSVLPQPQRQRNGEDGAGEEEVDRKQVTANEDEKGENEFPDAPSAKGKTRGRSKERRIFNATIGHAVRAKKERKHSSPPLTRPWDNLGSADIARATEVQVLDGERAESAEEYEMLARAEWERQEARRQTDCVVANVPYVRRHYPGDLVDHTGMNNAEQGQKPPRADGALADLFAAHAYGVGKTYAELCAKNEYITPYVSPAESNASGSKSVRTGVPASPIAQPNATPASPSPSRWSTVYPESSATSSPIANFLSTPAVPPISLLTKPVLSAAAPSNPNESASAPALSKGHDLARAALRQHTSAQAFARAGRAADAASAYHAAEIAYLAALEQLMPLRRTLSSDTSRRGRLDALVTRLMDGVEAVRALALPSAPKDMPYIPEDDHSDDKRGEKLHGDGDGGGGEVDAGEEPEPNEEQASALALPSAPTDTPPGLRLARRRSGRSAARSPASPSVKELEEEAENNTEVRRKCFACVADTAQMETPCRHAFCRPCGESVLELYGQKCPQCSKPCTLSELTIIGE